jgi:glutathione reductase (NADPH)
MKFDLFVIGAGSGGVRAARLAAAEGYRVGIAEGSRIGGTCVIRGCVPKKLMVYASEFKEMFEDAAGFGWETGNIRFDWNRLVKARDQEVDRLEDAYRNNLQKSNVKIFENFAKCVAANQIELDNGERIESDNILLATGGVPKKPDFDGVNLTMSSDDVFTLKKLPRRILIYGGGYIACEFASIFKGLGSEVYLVYRGENLLKTFDLDISQTLMSEFRNKGINLLLNSTIRKVIREGEELNIEVEGNKNIVVDQVLCATGRVPNIDNLGLEKVDVDVIKGAIAVDEYQKTNSPNIYAIGDVTDKINLTPVAIRDGIAFVNTVFKKIPTKPDHDLVPKAVFSQPEVGTVGLTEDEVKNLSKPYIVFKTYFKPMKNQLALKDEKTLMKLIVEKKTDLILGVHILGYGAAELIQAVAIAVKMGATKRDFDRTCAVHPTMAEELVTLN